MRARSAPFFLAVLAVCLAAAPAPTGAHGYKVGALSIGHIWAPPPEAGAAGLPVYGAFLNRGPETIRLVGVASPVAEHAGFRIGASRSGTGAERRETDAIPLPPGRPVALAPWRAHIWLRGLTGRPAAGASFDLTLRFDNGVTKTVTVVVEGVPGH